jgi:hypothetical protein
MASLRGTILQVVEKNAPVTVRQVFYQLVTQGAINKTESEYKATVVRLLTDMRIVGDLPFESIADNTRWMRKPNSFSSLEQALRNTAETYRRATWDNQTAYVEVWLEKDALAGVVYDETSRWDVPLMVTRGYPSVSYLHAAAQAINSCGKPAYLYYLGDHDPSGVDIPRNVEARLREFAPEAAIHFQRLAVTPKQIVELHLPTRPTKASDSRAKGFAGQSVEVDAIPPSELRGLVRRSIEQHVNKRALRTLQIAEKSEREIIGFLATKWKSAEIPNRGG